MPRQQPAMPLTRPEADPVGTRAVLLEKGTSVQHVRSPHAWSAAACTQPRNQRQACARLGGCWTLVPKDLWSMLRAAHAAWLMPFVQQRSGAAARPLQCTAASPASAAQQRPPGPCCLCKGFMAQSDAHLLGLLAEHALDAQALVRRHDDGGAFRP